MSDPNDQQANEPEPADPAVGPAAPEPGPTPQPAPAPPRTRHDVFLSYSSKNKAVADAVCATLERRGLRCWMAPRDITPGAEWAASIVQAINDSRAFVLIFSAFANTSSQVKREVERAANQSLPIIPFRIDDVPPNQTLEFFISTPHWLDALTPPLESHAEHLARVVGRLLDDAPPADPTEAEREASYRPHIAAPETLARPRPARRERDDDDEDDDEDDHRGRRRRRRVAHGAREQTAAAIRAIRRAQERRREGDADKSETAREISREIGRAVEGWQEYADRREKDEADDTVPSGPVLSPALAIALGLAVFIVPQLIVPGPAINAWRYVPLFLIPVAVSLWGLRLVSIVGGALIVGGSFIAAQAAAMLTERVFTYLPRATQGLVAAPEAARLAFVAGGVFTVAVLCLLLVFGRRLARPAGLTQAVLFGLGLPSLAAGLAYGYWETQTPSPQPWLAFVFYALWLAALAQGLFATATTRMSALLGGWRPPRGRDGVPVRAPPRQNHRQVWLIALLTLIGIGVVTVGPPIPFGGRGPSATSAAPPF